MVDSSSLKSSSSSARVFCFCALRAQGLEACRLKAEEEEGEERLVRIGELLRLRSDDGVEGRRKLWATCASRVRLRRTTRRAGCWWRCCSIWELRIVECC
jgi:hypothetical protein